MRFWKDQKRSEESYREWMHLEDCFSKWTRDQSMSLRGLVILEHCIQDVPENLRIWLQEKKLVTLRRQLF